MHTLTDIFHQAGCHDQLNLGALAVPWDWSVVVYNNKTEACAHGADAPNWASAKHFSGSSSSLDLVPPEKRSYASRPSREQAELETPASESENTRSRRQPRGRRPRLLQFLVGGLPGGAVCHCDEG